MKIYLLELTSLIQVDWLEWVSPPNRFVELDLTWLTGITCVLINTRQLNNIALPGNIILFYFKALTVHINSLSRHIRLKIDWSTLSSRCFINFGSTLANIRRCNVHSWLITWRRHLTLHASTLPQRLSNVETWCNEIDNVISTYTHKRVLTNLLVLNSRIYFTSEKTNDHLWDISSGLTYQNYAQITRRVALRTTDTPLEFYCKSYSHTLRLTASHNAI